MNSVAELYRGQKEEFAAQEKRVKEATKKMHTQLFDAQIEIIEVMQSSFPRNGVERAIRKLNQAYLQALIIEPEDA